MNPDLKAAVLGAANITASPSPLGNFPEIANLYRIDRQLPTAIGAANAGATIAQQQVDEQERQAKIAAANAERATKQAEKRAADMQDIGKYRFVRKKDGGFDIFDPNGDPVSVSEAADRTGSNPNELLKNSRNPIDRAFLQDYKQLNDYINNKLNARNDPKARAAAQAVETQVRKLYNIKLHDQTPNEVINAFVAAYPTIYGGQQPGTLLPSAKYGGQQPGTLLPSANTIKTNAKKRGRLDNGTL